MTIVQQVATLRKRAGLPATRIGEIAGTDASNIYAIEHGRRDPAASTLERIASAAGVKILAVQSEGAAFVSETTEVLRERVASGDVEGAYRQLIQISDDLSGATATTCVFLTYIEPSAISPGWDAAVAGVVEWRLTQKLAPLPEWIQRFGSAVDEPWEPLSAPYKINEQDVPEPLRRRNIWIEQAELESV